MRKSLSTLYQLVEPVLTGKRSLKESVDDLHRARTGFRKLRRLLSSNLYFFEASEVARELCPACGEGQPMLSAYPYSDSALFSPLVTCWCRVCGMGWVPTIPFSLEEYYSSAYAESNRGDRRIPPAEYFAMVGGPESEMTIPKLVPYTRRARAQLAKLEEFVPARYSLLEFGAGPGYGLYFSNAEAKHAVEHDEASVKYLEHLGVQRVELGEAEPGRYDAVLASHSLEHLAVDSLYPTLGLFRKALKSEGVLYVEVPNGAHTGSYLPGNHSPHTLFFSMRALKTVVERAGFEIIYSETRTKKKGQKLERPIHTEKELEQAPDAQGLTVVARPRHGELVVPSLPPRPGVKAVVGAD